jgi:hypothetical protein
MNLFLLDGLGLGAGAGAHGLGGVHLANVHIVQRLGFWISLLLGGGGEPRWGLEMHLHWSRAPGLYHYMSFIDRL